MSWDWIKSCFNSNAWYESVGNCANKVSDVVVPLLGNTINKISTVWEQLGLQYSRYKPTTQYKSQYDQMITQVYDKHYKHYKHLTKEKFEELYVCRLVQASIVMRNTRIEYKLIRDIFLEVDRKDQEADDVAKPKKEYYDIYNQILPLGVNVLLKNVDRYRVDYVNDRLNSLKPYSVDYLLKNVKPESVNTTGEKKLHKVDDPSYYIQSDRYINIRSVLYEPQQIGSAHNEGNKLAGVEAKSSEGQETDDY